MQVLCHIRNDEDDLRKCIENKHFIVGGRENRVSTVSNSSESSDEDTTKHEWRNEDSISEPPIGKNLNSKHEMLPDAATKLTQIYRKKIFKTVKKVY